MDKQVFLGRVEEALRSTPGSIKESDHLQNLAGWDSIGALSIIALVDEHYGITLNAAALANCQLVGDLVQLVEKGR